MSDEAIKQRFLAKLRLSETGCLEFQGAKDKKGYGRFSISSARHSVPAHRVAWEIFEGPIPAGMFVLHRCDNPPCVRVAHLFLGTLNDNNQDMVRKGRVQRANALKTHCKHGHPYAGTNLYIAPDGSRDCRICRRGASARSRQNRKAVAL